MKIIDKLILKYGLHKLWRNRVYLRLYDFLNGKDADEIEKALEESIDSNVEKANEIMKWLMINFYIRHKNMSFYSEYNTVDNQGQLRLLLNLIGQVEESISPGKEEKRKRREELRKMQLEAKQNQYMPQGKR